MALVVGGAAQKGDGGGVWRIPPSRELTGRAVSVAAAQMASRLPPTLADLFGVIKRRRSPTPTPHPQQIKVSRHPLWLLSSKAAGGDSTADPPRAAD